MKTRVLGNGEPEHAVMYCVHGDEPCGKLAVERILHEDMELKKPLKLVYANEKAHKKGKKYLDQDLNRAWASDGENHESKLACRLVDELQGMEVLDLHSAYSHPEPFGIAPSANMLNGFEGLGLRNIVDLSPVYDSEIQVCKRLAVECGYTKSEGAIRNAYKFIKNFMAVNGIADFKLPDKAKKSFFRVFDTDTNGDFQFVKKNFQRVQKGELYGIKSDRKLRAEESFYPVLMSTNGYEEILGFKSRKIPEEDLTT